MRKIVLSLLCIGLFMSGCSKPQVVSVDTDVIKIEVNSELSDEMILSHVKCGGKSCSDDLEFDIFKNDLNVRKVGSYTIDIMVDGSGYPLRIDVVDLENPEIIIDDFSVNQNENIIWNRSMFNKINLQVKDNATSEETLYDRLKVSGLDTSVSGVQEVTFSLSDESNNKVEKKVSVNVIEKPVEVIHPPVPPVVVPPLIEEPPLVNEPEEEVKPDEVKPIDPVVPPIEEVEDPKEEVQPSKIQVKTTNEVLDLLKTSKEYQVVYVSQTWCSHCQAFIKTLNSYLEGRDDLTLIEIVLDKEEQKEITETDENGNTVQKFIYPDFETFKLTYSIDFIGTPSMFIFKDQKVVGSLVGNESKENLELFLDGISNNAKE